MKEQWSAVGLTLGGLGIWRGRLSGDPWMPLKDVLGEIIVRDGEDDVKVEEENFEMYESRSSLDRDDSDRSSP